MAVDAVKEVLPVEVAEHVSCACLCISTPQQVMKTTRIMQHVIQEDARWCNAIAGERRCMVPWTRTLALHTWFSWSVSQSGVEQSLWAARQFDSLAPSFKEANKIKSDTDKHDYHQESCHYSWRNQGTKD